MIEYFPHDYKSRHDSKLVALFMELGLEGIGCYWCVVEMLYEAGGYIDESEYRRIAFELRAEENLVQNVVNQYGLFAKSGTKFYSESVLKRMQIREQKSENAKKAINKRWANYKKNEEVNTNVLPTYYDRNTNVIQTKYDRNTIKEKKRKEKESKDRIEDLDSVTDKLVILDSVSVLDKEKIKEKENLVKEKEKQKESLVVKRFRKPTVEEVREYCREKGYQVDVEYFWNHYETVGWLYGRNKVPMKSWKSAVAGWASRNKQQGGTVESVPPRNNPNKLSDEDRAILNFLGNKQ